MIRRLIKWLIADEVRKSIIHAEAKRGDIEKAVIDIKTRLNHEDRWFLKVCSADDPDGKDCKQNCSEKE